MTRFLAAVLIAVSIGCTRSGEPPEHPADSPPGMPQSAEAPATVTGPAAPASAPAGESAPDPSAQTLGLLAGLDVTFSSEVVGPSEPLFGILRFSYQSNQAAWPYGSGFSVTNPTGTDVVWIYLHHGDYSPRTVHQADFDGDGRLDLFFYAGFEDVFETHVYLNRVASTTYAVSSFALGYQNDEAYASVGDFDGDGLPELLVPEAQGYGDEEPPFCGNGLSHSEILEAATEEYNRVMAPFDSLNFRYGAPGYRAINMFLTDSIRIFSLHGSGRDVTRQHRSHLEWREQILTRLLALVEAECAPALIETRSYIRERLGR